MTKPSSTPVPLPCRGITTLYKSLTSSFPPPCCGGGGGVAPVWKAAEKYGRGVRGCASSPASAPLNEKVCQPLMSTVVRLSHDRLRHQSPPIAAESAASAVGARAHSAATLETVGESSANATSRARAAGAMAPVSAAVAVDRVARARAVRTLVVADLVAGDAPAAAAAAAMQSSRSTEAKERCSSNAPLSAAAASAAAPPPPPTPNGVSCSCNSAPRAYGTISSTHSSGGQPPSDAPKPTVPLSASAAASWEVLLVLVLLVPPVLLPPASSPGSSTSRSSCFAVASDSRSAHALPRVVPCSTGARTRTVPPECLRVHASSRAPTRDETRRPRSRSRAASRPRSRSTFSRSTTASATSRSSSSSSSFSIWPRTKKSCATTPSGIRPGGLAPEGIRPGIRVPLPLRLSLLRPPAATTRVLSGSGIAATATASATVAGLPTLAAAPAVPCSSISLMRPASGVRGGAKEATTDMKPLPNLSTSLPMLSPATARPLSKPLPSFSTSLPSFSTSLPIPPPASVRPLSIISMPFSTASTWPRTPLAMPRSKLAIGSGSTSQVTMSPLALFLRPTLL